MQLARDIDQRRLGLRQGRHPRRGITREEIGKRSSQENTDLCPHWKEAPGVSSTGWWQDRVEIREGTIFIEKKKDAKTDVDPTGQIMPSLVGVFFYFGCVRYIAY